MAQSAAFSIRPISDEDKDRVLNFLRMYFFRDEPLLDYLRLLEGPYSRSKELEDFSVECLRDGKWDNITRTNNKR